MYEDQEDVLGLIVTHGQSIVWCLNLAKTYELVDVDVAAELMEQMAHESKTEWEEEFWLEIKESFLYKEKVNSSNVYQFTPDPNSRETKGPDK